MIAGPSGSRASFTYVMAQFRRILVSYGGIPADVVHNYSLHSLKATPLSWALQVEVEPTMSRLWGHHRSSEHGEAMVRAQRAVESAEGYLGRLGAFDPTGPRWQVASCRVRAGSEAAQPHGGPPGLLPPRCANGDSDTEPESCSDGECCCSSSSSSSSDSDSEYRTGADSKIGDPLVPGVWILNTLSGCVHAAASVVMMKEVWAEHALLLVLPQPRAGKFGTRIQPWHSIRASMRPVLEPSGWIKCESQPDSL